MCISVFFYTTYTLNNDVYSYKDSHSNDKIIIEI